MKPNDHIHETHGREDKQGTGEEIERTTLANLPILHDRSHDSGKKFRPYHYQYTCSSLRFLKISTVMYGAFPAAFRLSIGGTESAP